MNHSYNAAHRHNNPANHTASTLPTLFAMTPPHPSRRDMASRAALTTIQGLIETAGKLFSTNPLQSNRYARKAKRIAMKHKLRLPCQLKRRICKGCSAFLVPGKNCRIRTQRGHVVIYCTACKRMTRIRYQKRGK